MPAPPPPSSLWVVRNKPSLRWQGELTCAASVHPGGSEAVLEGPQVALSAPQNCRAHLGAGPGILLGAVTVEGGRSSGHSSEAGASR